MLNIIHYVAFVIFQPRFSKFLYNVLYSVKAGLKLTCDNQKDKEKSIMDPILLNVSMFDRVHNHDASVKLKRKKKNTRTI